ncbi:MAG TPA: cytochrome d ubiquinol oxidase subunit II [Gemmatimonadota bacterium]|nr:cytochrome d ubiquinol oxidase subunit II [Gemmatimonadota bacterium]
METIWFWFVAFLLTMYVLLDGFDLGAGALHLVVARTDEERRTVLRSIGPVWDGNEVWLIAGGGTLYFAFPALYASSFSGFYLPLMLVLWLLVLRGISIEFRSHLENRVWAPFWDVVFAGASLLLALFLGAALGNVVRGVPLGEAGWFFVPLWTDFLVGPDPGVLDFYTLSVGLTALAALALHGALWLSHKTEGDVQARARRAAGRLWWAVVGGTLLITALTWWVQPLVPRHLGERPWAWVFPALALAGLAAIRRALAARKDLPGFLGSCAFLAGMLASAAVSLYPYVLPSVGPGPGLTVHTAAAARSGLAIGLAWWIPGMALALAYVVFLYRRFRGKVSLEGEGY